MANYRIVCTDQFPTSEPTTHAHIVAVGGGPNPDSASARLTLDEILDAMRRGDSFYTHGTYTGKIARVQEYVCRLCRRTHIRSAPDAVYDNNLDDLRSCSWTT